MELLERNVETVLPSKEALEKKLQKGKLRIKHGIDPTGPKIHIGRAVVLWKLREFQDAGHKIVLIFGDFTARIGDPSDKDKRRPLLSEDQIKVNTAGYLDQIGRILDTSKVEVHYNSEWHGAMSEADLITLARLLTVNQMLARRNFSERVKEKKEIGIDEFLYPLLQGYDSVAVRADVELGGSDQLFNLQAGRIIQEAYGQEPQCIMTTGMLWGLDSRKMSTSWGNVVNITDEPNEMYGKLMSLNDELMPNYLRLTTRLSEQEIKEIEAIAHPKKRKEQLAYEVVKLYHGKGAATKAKEEFKKVFTQKELPIDIKEVFVEKGLYTVHDLLSRCALMLSNSKSEARRLILQGGVRVNDEVVTSPSQLIQITKPILLSKGKRNIVKIVPNYHEVQKRKKA